jgi:PKD repeat protein
VSKSDTINVTVNAKPKADFSTTGDLMTQIPITFTDKSTSAVTWFWNFGDGLSSTVQNPVHTYSVTAKSVSLTVTAANNCTDTKTSAVNVITAIENSVPDGVTIYPNPVKDQGLQIEVNNTNLQGANIVLTNSLGQTIYAQDISALGSTAQVTIPSTALPEGLYIVRVNVGNKTTVRKVIKAQ